MWTLLRCNRVPKLEICESISCDYNTSQLNENGTTNYPPYNGTFWLCDAGALADHIGKETGASETIVWVLAE